MKKAFALALAVLMVCTMAFAVSTGNQTGYPGGTSAADNTYMQSIVPGQSIVFTQEELGLTDQNWGKTNGSFDPKKNTVTLTVPVGSDLIASQGWVRTDETTYKYVVTTKANETSVLDNNADIIISGVKVTVYGVSAPALNVSYVKDVNGVTNYSGWRPQELGLLELKNVDLENWTFRGGIKTDAGTDRVVPIHSKIRHLVERKYKEAQELGSLYLLNYVNSNARSKNTAITYARYQKGFGMIRDELNLNPEHRPHDGRKHFVTMAKKYGVDEYAIKYMVGHKISDITEKVYTQREFEWLKDEIEKIK